MGAESWLRRLKAAARPLQHTPFHPQWLAIRSAAAIGPWLAAARGRVLDVGSASQWPRALLPPGCDYLAIDHPASASSYGSRPDVQGDAHTLPFADDSIDLALLLDVLEHLHDPERALAEVRRVLKPGGALLIGVPFLYPLHDLPHDYSRWTGPGLRNLARRGGFEVDTLIHRSQPMETAALLFNLGLVDSALLALRERRIGAVLLPLVPAIVLCANLAGWALGALLGANPRMPHAYLARWTRPVAGAIASGPIAPYI